VSSLTVHEFDLLAAPSPGGIQGSVSGFHIVPTNVFRWLETQCLRNAGNGEAAWLRLTQRGGHRAIQVTSFVGVIRSPDGYQVEVLPKVGKSMPGGAAEARRLLIEMLCCLHGFRHVQTEHAKLIASRMPLLEVFIAEFLRAVERVVKRGIRGDYVLRRDNLLTLRGKMMVGQHVRQNICRADRFFSEHDEFSKDRPENRLLHAAVCRALSWSASRDNQQLARELRFVFQDVPLCVEPSLDFKRTRLDRGMTHYADALAWARLILNDESPLSSSGGYRAPSLLFPMEAVFEAFVARHLARQLKRPLFVKAQARAHYLVRHRQQKWFCLRPDLLIRDQRDHLVLDAKWKLLDAGKANGSDKYGLSQSDFYQLQSYGLSYMDGQGDVVLIYPRTTEFDQPLPVFEFPKSEGLRLWVLPFCLKTRMLLLPPGSTFAARLFRQS
jgi:5-methylcytosine-specific restriction enzyme subunit McrC